jgi:ABC-2 type transport system ATP-binding protein
MDKVIQVDKLSKSFAIRENFPGILGALKALFISQSTKFPAIKEISFSIKRGERVAFIGPNGAGKSTTIKMLTGILYPDSGSIEVLNLVPWKERHSLGYKIGTVFGQRSSLSYFLPPRDTFHLLSKIYELDSLTYKKQLTELSDIFEIHPFLDKPVRQLSLGERMRCEIVASLLHKPDILFLDEPTIGLDVNAKLKIRALLNKLSKETKTTLFLTSHDTADIEQVCDRVIVLDKGSIILDTTLRELKKTTVKKKILSITTDQEKLSLMLPHVKVIENKNYNFICEIDLEKTTTDKIVHEVLKLTGIKDITIEDPSMEEIIRDLYGA